MKKITFKAKTGPIIVGEDERILSIEELKQLDGIDCQEDFSEYSDFEDKLGKGFMSFKLEGSTLFTITEYDLKEELTPDEIEKLEEETQGQWSDGIGEGFEQTPCSYINNEEVYICPWYSGQTIETIVE